MQKESQDWDLAFAAHSGQKEQPIHRRGEGGALWSQGLTGVSSLVMVLSPEISEAE